MVKELEELTKEELIEKIQNERLTFKQALLSRDEDKARAMAQVRHVADLVIARMVRSYGTQEEDEFVLDIPKPEEPKGKAWVTKVEQPDPETYRIRAREIELMDI